MRIVIKFTLYCHLSQCHSAEPEDVVEKLLEMTENSRSQVQTKPNIVTLEIFFLPFRPLLPSPFPAPSPRPLLLQFTAKCPLCRPRPPPLSGALWPPVGSITGSQSPSRSNKIQSQNQNKRISVTGSKVTRTEARKSWV